MSARNAAICEALRRCSNREHSPTCVFIRQAFTGGGQVKATASLTLRLSLACADMAEKHADFSSRYHHRGP